MGKTAFVTGGTGFVGSHLVEELKRRDYDEIRCLVRKDLKWLKGLDVLPVNGDLSSLEVLWEALKGVDYVYHVAGVTRATDWETFEQGNIRSTLNLLGSVRQAAPGVKKVLLTSTLAAVGACPDGVATETSPLNPISRYGQSKARMEQALYEPLADETRYVDELPLVIVRPPAVYGPRDADIFTVFQTAQKGVFPILGTGKKPDVTLVHVRDLVRGMVDAAECKGTTGHTYFIGSDPPHSWNEVRDATMKALGKHSIPIYIPPAVTGVVGAVAELAGRISGTYPPLNREKAREIRYACKMCSSEKAGRDFGYRAEIPLDRGIKETIDWYRREGWL